MNPTAPSLPTPVPGIAENLSDDPRQRAPLVLGGRDFASVTQTVTGVVQRRTPAAWYVAFTISLSLLALFVVTIVHLVTTGVGVWGNNNTVSWGFPIVNFVFWVGIGHAGTLISAILFLLRQNWRTGINRFAEAMTIFAVCCAGLFPVLHVGRLWLAYWLFPLPNQMAMWPQARSPLLWDVFAVSTYFVVSLLFWYMGMVPDLATLRDRAKSRIGQWLYGHFALGWTGSCRHWLRFERAYLILAALATPLVLSVHSVVSFDFATSQVPGWHTTIFPPYFVAGAVFGGFAMVLTLAIPARQWFGLKDLITQRHLENMSKVMLGTGLIVAYAYTVEFCTAWYSGEHYEQFVFLNRPLGPYWWAFFVMFGCNVVAPQVLWIPRMRRKIWVMFAVAMCVNVGMWFERFVIVVTSLHRDYLPSSWGSFSPTGVDLAMLIGSFGLFFSLFLLFCRFLPAVAMAEVKTVMPQAHAVSTLSDYQPDPEVVEPKGYRPPLHPHPPAEDREEELAEPPERVFALAARFQDVGQVMKAAASVRAARYRLWDVHSPLPLHGINKAMGLRETMLPWISLLHGLLGLGLGLGLVWWINASTVDGVPTMLQGYEFLVSGKPRFSLPANIPILFETTVLVAAIGTVLGMLGLNKLPMLHNPLLRHPSFTRATDDRFFVVIEARDPLFDFAATQRLLRSLGAESVEVITR